MTQHLALDPTSFPPLSEERLTSALWRDRAWWPVIVIAFLPLLPFAFNAPRTLDYWFFLAKGERLWELGWAGLSTTNPFVFTLPAANEYIDHEWLYAVLVRAYWNLTGHPGMVIARGLVIFGWCYFFLAIARRLGASRWLALGVFGFGAYSVLITRMSIRPHILSYLFFLILFWAVLHPPTRRTLIGIGGMFVLWANLHGSFAMAGVSLGVIGVWAILAPLWFRERDPELAAYIARWRDWWKLLIPLPILIFINPYGWRLWTILWTYQREISSAPDPIVAAEWRAFALDDVYAQFFIVLVFTALVSWFLPGRRLRSQWLLWIAVIVAFVFSNVRFVGLSFLLLGPLVAAQLSALQKPSLRIALLGIFGFCSAILAVYMWIFSSAYRFHPDLREIPHEPMELLSRYPQTPIRLFSNLNAVGYTAFRAYRHVRVAYDANPVTGFKAWSREYKAALLDLDVWQAYCRKHQCNAVLLDLRDGLLTPLAFHLASSKEWRALYLGLEWSLYIRRQGEPPAFAGIGYQHLTAFFEYDSLLNVPQDRLRSEITRLEVQPGGRPLATFLRAWLAAEAEGLAPEMELPFPPDALRRLQPSFEALRRVREDSPWHPGIAYLLGLSFLAQGQPALALPLLKEARSWHPLWQKPRQALLRLQDPSL